MGLEYARKNDYKYYCHIDDDDYWEVNHLQNFYNIFSRYPNCIFSCSQSNYNGNRLPSYRCAISENNFLPNEAKLIHSSACFRIDIIQFNYHTASEDKDVLEPSDANMWKNINKFLKEHNNYSSIYIPELTCIHDVEGEARK